MRCRRRGSIDCERARPLRKRGNPHAKSVRLNADAARQSCLAGLIPMSMRSTFSAMPTNEGSGRSGLRRWSSGGLG
jgi:hypothetical protein